MVRFLILAILLALWPVAVAAQEAPRQLVPVAQTGMSLIDGAAIGLFVMGLTEFAKWAKWIKPTSAPAAVLFLAALGEGLWLVSQPALPVRTDIWAIAVNWIGVAAAAAGSFGFARVAKGSLSPGGA